MMCNICNEREATVHLTEIVDNNVTKLHLCEDCARKKGTEMEEHFGLSDLLAGLADFETKTPSKKEVKKKCSKCGMVYDDFKKLGRLGCGECYTAFNDHLSPLIKRIHGSLEHYGKSPSGVSRVSGKEAPVKEAPAKEVSGKEPARKKEPQTMDELRALLQRAIKMEEFEEAARLRDKIRELEKKEPERKR